MPRSLPLRPRKMLPPPTTSTTCTPSCFTSPICCAIPCTACGEMPIPCSPPSASPLSLSRTRPYLGCFWLFIVANPYVAARRPNVNPKRGVRRPENRGEHSQGASAREKYASPRGYGGCSNPVPRRTHPSVLLPPTQHPPRCP